MEERQLEDEKLKFYWIRNNRRMRERMNAVARKVEDIEGLRRFHAAWMQVRLLLIGLRANWC